MTIRRSMAALAAAPLFLLAACGGDASDLVEDSATPPAATTQAGSTPDPGSGETPGSSPGGLTEQTFAQEVAAAQLAARTTHVSADITASGQRISLEGDVEFGVKLADYAVDITMNVPGMGDLRMVIVDESLYMNLGQLTQDKFAKVDLDDSSSPTGAMASSLMGSADLAATLKAMQDGLISLQQVGTEQIDGVATTHYRVEVDTRKILAAQGIGDLAAAGQLPESLTYDLWIGDDDLMRRMSFSLGTAMSLTMNLTAWGEPVDISAPPPSQVTEGDPFAPPTG